MTLITVNGLPDNDVVPGTDYIQINLGAGPASGGDVAYSAVILANKLSSGSSGDDGYLAGPDVLQLLTSEAQAIALYGPGSAAQRIYSKFIEVNLGTACYVCTVKESVGSAAIGTIVVSGSTATANSAIRVRVQDETVDVSVVIGDTPTIVANSIAAAINAKTLWAVTAAPSTGTVTVTAKQKGPRGNLIGIQARIQEACGLACTAGVLTKLSGGTVLDDNTDALATISGRKFAYIISEACDATNLANLANHVDSESGALVGLRQQAFYGSKDTLANLITITTAMNMARTEVAWLEDSDLSPGELAASVAAAYSSMEASFGANSLNFSGFGKDAETQPLWKVKAPSNGGTPSRSELVSALNHGITPIDVSPGGSTFIVKRVTNRFLNGSTTDFRVRESHRVTVCDHFADELQVIYAAELSRKLIGDDPPEGVSPGPNTVTSQDVKRLVAQLVRVFGARGLLKNVETIIAKTLVDRQSPSRLGVRVPLQPADILDQVVTAIDQVA